MRAGVPSPVGLAATDTLHLLSGAAGVGLLVAKLRQRGPRPPSPPWFRWVGLSLALLYPASWLSGAAALLPVGATLHADLVNLHLLTSVWALAPTALHVWQQRAGLRALVARTRRRPRLGAGLAVGLLPALALALVPVSLSFPARAGAGPGWTPSGLGGIAVSRLAATGDGALLAVGDGVYLSADGRRWSPVALDGPPATAGEDSGHPHEAAPAPAAGRIRDLLVTETSGRVYLVQGGTLLEARSAAGPYSALDAPADIRAIADEPGNPYVLVVATGGGPFMTVDGGHTWTRLADGIARSDHMVAVAWAAGAFYASDLEAVYRFEPELESWTQVLRLGQVTGLSRAGADLYATSHAGGAWRVAPGPPARVLDAGAHQHGSHPGVLAVAGGDGRIYGSGASGVTVSTDGGRNWSPLAATGQPVSQVVVGRRRLFAATPDGVLALDLEAQRAPAPAWLALGGALLLAGSAASLHLLGALRRRPAHARARAWPSSPLP